MREAAGAETEGRGAADFPAAPRTQRLKLLLTLDGAGPDLNERGSRIHIDHYSQTTACDVGDPAFRGRLASDCDGQCVASRVRRIGRIRTGNRRARRLRGRRHTWVDVIDRRGARRGAVATDDLSDCVD